MKQTVYIETTVPSYYHEVRKELAIHTARSRQWWDCERIEYECFTSEIVIDELSEGNYPTKRDCLDLMAGVPRLEVNDEVLETAEVYWARQLMPRPPVRDALHLAVASVYGIDFLLTWNCAHLANANKTRHIMRVNQSLGLRVPQLVTPMQLRLLEDSP